MCVHSSNAVCAGLAKGYQREPLARCHETNFARGACVCICSRSVWRRGRRSCRRLPVISVVVVVVVVAVAVCRLQRRRVSAHAVADGKQELESRIRPVVELGQTAIT